MGSSRYLVLGDFRFHCLGSCAPGGKLLSLVVVITDLGYNELRNKKPCLLD